MVLIRGTSQQPGRRGSDLHVADEARRVARAQLRVLQPHGHQIEFGMTTRLDPDGFALELKPAVDQAGPQVENLPGILEFLRLCARTATFCPGQTQAPQMKAVRIFTEPFK